MKSQMWFRVDPHMVYDPFIRRLMVHYGLEGFAVWFALLAAAKLSPAEGVFRYATERDGWLALGFDQEVWPKWTLEGFLAWTGQQQKTRVRTRGGMREVTIRAFPKWQTLRQGNGEVNAAETSRPRSVSERPRFVHDQSMQIHDHLAHGKSAGQSIQKRALRFREGEEKNLRPRARTRGESESDGENPAALAPDAQVRNLAALRLSLDAMKPKDGNEGSRR